uniref:Uncharacterized protein n=1 Tax=Geladintestivirus 1 TaxID=3233133 RepID=A0AAU8MIA4_9CAUD
MPTNKRKIVYKSKSGKIYDTPEEARIDREYSIKEKIINGFRNAYNGVSNYFFNNSNLKAKQINNRNINKQKVRNVNNPYNSSTRIRNNNSRSRVLSEIFENGMNKNINIDKTSRNYDKRYDIVHTGKTIPYRGTLIDIAGLDSIAKQAAIYNKNPTFPQYEKPRSKNAKRVNLEEVLGLPLQETVGGHTAYFNTGKYSFDDNKRFLNNNGYKDKNITKEKIDNAIMNTNYLRNFGSIPASNYVRDFRYIADVVPQLYPDGKSKMINRNTHPLYHAIQYFANGNYNPGSQSHTEDVRNEGKNFLKELKKYPKYYQEVMDFYTGIRTQ